MAEPGAIASRDPSVPGTPTTYETARHRASCLQADKARQRERWHGPITREPGWLAHITTAGLLPLSGDDGHQPRTHNRMRDGRNDGAMIASILPREREDG
jgi:hypothetical protein